MISTGEAVAINRAQNRILALCLSVKKKFGSEYRQALICQGLLQMWHREEDTLTWRIFKHDPTMFNEGVGEMSLSVLARWLQGSPSKSDVSAVQRKYQMCTAAMRSSAMMQGNDEWKEDGAKKGGKRVRQDCDEVGVVTAFFELQVELLSNSTYRHYNEKKWLDFKQAGAITVAPADDIKRIMVSPAVLRSRLDASVAQVKNEVVRHYSQTMPDLFPSSGAQADVSEHSDDEPMPPRGVNRKRKTPPHSPVDDDADVDDGKLDENEEEQEQEEEDEDEDEDEDDGDPMTLTEALGQNHFLNITLGDMGRGLMKVKSKLVLKFNDGSWGRGYVKRHARNNPQGRYVVSYVTQGGLLRYQDLLDADRIRDPNDIEHAPFGAWTPIRYRA